MQPTDAGPRTGEPVGPPARRHGPDLAVAVLTGVLLLAAGVLLGLLGSFLVPAREFGVPGVAVVVAVVGNLVLGTLGARGLRSRLVGALPGIGWVVVVLLAGVRRAEGDLVIPGHVAAAPSIGRVGYAFIIAGIVAAAAPVWPDPRRPLRWRRPASAVRPGAAGDPSLREPPRR